MLPDSAGDKGRHFTRYAILPHAEGFSAKSVVQPAYAFNYLPIAGKRMENSLVSVDKDNIIIEAVKPLEDAENAYILRLYDAAGDYTKTNLSFGHAVKRICQCNMLEEEIADIEINQLTFKPFEIKTVKVEY